jgi:hypothetical protein
MPTAVSASARIRRLVSGVPALFVRSSPRSIRCASSDTLATGESLGTALISGAHAVGAAVGALVSCGMVADAAGGSGIWAVFSSCPLCSSGWSAVALLAVAVVSGAGAAVGSPVSVEVCACEGDGGGIDSVFSSRPLWSIVFSVVALFAGAAVGLTARLSTDAGGEAVSAEVTDTGAPSAAGLGPAPAAVGRDDVARAIFAGGGACCAGCPAGRIYQHFRWVARSNR